MKLAPVLLVGLILVGCGSSGARPPGVVAPAVKGGPPAAWLETKAGSHWLGHSSSCWPRIEGASRSEVCADFRSPRCGQSSVPSISVERGETLRAHLGFDPVEASVEHARTTLEGRTVKWQIDRAGPFLLFARAKDGDASYAGCAVLR